LALPVAENLPCFEVLIACTILSTDVKIEGNLFLEAMNLYDKKNSVTEIRKRIGMVFQKPNPLPKSIYENLSYALKIHNYPKNEIPDLIENALKESFFMG
jgi:phosphate transport system ATP-binding protein